ncbi:toll/interleukin-1 receptor domain-containing protein [Mycobacterium sp. URHB0021]
MFAPREVQPGQTFMVRVFAHLPSEDEEVEALARKFDDSSRPMGTDVLDSRVREGERLAFELRLPELLVDDPVQSMVWVGQPRSVQFGVTVPTDSTPQTVIGTVTISRASVPIGRVTFMVNVSEPEPGLVPGLPSAPRYPALRPNYHRYRRAFISYASADRKEVLKRTQMLPGAGIDFFHDILTLDPGQRWERQLYYEIDRCDLFLLFWSSAAKT